jgi:hypothetical protein
MAKTVATPHDAYIEKEPLWVRARAVCGGERAVKEHDLLVHNKENFLIPFSPTMNQIQYDFLKREAELPGITAMFSRTLVGGLLRKEPELKLPKDAPKDALDWLKNQFSVDDSSLYTFLDVLLWDEIQTSRPWVFVDYPDVEVDDKGVPIESAPGEEPMPYSLLYKAEQVINWQVGRGPDGKEQLNLVVVKLVHEEDDPQSEFHKKLTTRHQTHDLFTGEYRVREWAFNKIKREWYQDGPDKWPEFQGSRMDYIPAWPANGQIDPIDPILTTIVDKEIALYNKFARRNHLLYGAATYTPVLKSDMDEPSFKKIAGAGLGTWLQIGKEDELDVLKTPTEALADLDRSIAASIEEIARLGVRMLTPEVEQSGVALQLRNASQNAQLGTLNSRISSVMQQVIALMLNWRYGTEYDAKDIVFQLSDDFDQTPLGEGWVRLATEWYEAGKIPRTLWLTICKRNDIVPPDYDDEAGRKEIDKEKADFEESELSSYSDRLKVEAEAAGAADEAGDKE